MRHSGLMLAGFAFVMLGACSSGSDSPGPTNPPPAPVGLLSPVTDTAVFSAAIKNGLAEMTNPDVLEYAATAADLSFTGTYTQELDVDEADGVRYDGAYLFVAPRRYAHCCFILDQAFAPNEPPPNRIRILATDPGNAAASLVSEIELDYGESVQGMYLDDSRMFTLTAEASYGSYGQPWADIAIWAPEKFGISVYDVSDAANPVLDFEATVDGVFVESRRVGNTIYIVSRYAPWVEGLNYYVTTDAQRTENENLLAAATLEDLLPRITIDGQTELLVQPENCYVTTNDDTDNNPVLTSITAVPIDDPANFTTACYNESAYGVYVAESSLYFTELRPNTALQRDITRIHKFALTGTVIAYRGSVDIEGTVWQGNQSDFRLSEDNGDLRVLASQFDWTSDDFVDHELYILRESSATPDLEIVSTLPNDARPEEIGKPNEALFGVRFLEDRAYAVTFEQVDPLYVIDLSNPEDPFIAGELEVPGVSDFLHPVTDELLLGLGRAAGGGIKLELFDASVISQPLSRGAVIMGGSGSYSELIYDRHAFTYQADVGGIDRFTVPVNLYAEDGSFQFLGSMLSLFEIHDKTTPMLATLNAVGQVQPPSPGTDPEWIERSRAFIHDDTVYYVRDEAVWAFTWNAPFNLNGPY